MAEESMKDKLMRLIGLEPNDDDDYPDEQDESPYFRTTRGSSGGRLTSMPRDEYDQSAPRARTISSARRADDEYGGYASSRMGAQAVAGSQMKMILFQPMSYGDTETIVDNVRQNKPVVINVEQLDIEVSQRVLDYVTGAAYALGGTIRRISRMIYLVSPKNVDVSGNLVESVRGRSSSIGSSTLGSSSRIDLE